MAGFGDRVLLQLTAPGALVELLAPGGVPLVPDLAMLLGSVFDLDHVRIDHIDAVTVGAVEVQVPFYPAQRHRGSWTRNMPQYLTTEVNVDTRDYAAPVWADLVARVTVHAIAEVDPGGVESVLSRDIDDFATLDEFRARFRFIDLDEFMARHRLHTVEDLREAYDYLKTEVRFHQPGPFNPADPANAHHIEFDLAVLIRDGLDLVDALRSAVTLRTVAGQLRTGPKDALLGRPESPLAIAVAVDRTALDQTATAATVRALLARSQVLGLVVDPA